jgi:hypothetical protein
VDSDSVSESVLVGAASRVHSRSYSEEARLKLSRVYAYEMPTRTTPTLGTRSAGLTLKCTSGLILVRDERLLRYARRGTRCPSLRDLQ